MNSSRSTGGGNGRSKAVPRFPCRARTPDRLVLPGVRLFDPALHVDRSADILVADGRIASLEATSGDAQDARVADELSGCTVFPGFVDIHAHLRTPGFEYKEDIASATRAAAAGGYVLVVGMANTDPVVDSGPVAGWVLDEAARTGDVRVGQVGSVTRGQSGAELAELWDLHDAGVVGFSDDGRPVADPNLLLHALRYLRGSGRPVLLHVDDPKLVDDGAMHEGPWSARLGLKGIPSLAETSPLAEVLDVLAYATEEARRLGAEPVHVHVQHISTRGGVSLIKRARESGLPVTAEATPHHLLLTDERVRFFDQNLKMNPPLRTADDRSALVEGLDGDAVTCVATDHAPHASHEKEVPFAEAPFGTVGLESALPALYGGLVRTGRLGLDRLIESLSSAPCRVLGVEPPRLEEGAAADFCVVDLEESWRFSETDLAGKSRNSAFIGERVQGRIRMTVAGGEIVWDHE